MSAGGLVSIYSNVVSILLLVGMIALVQKAKIEDPVEKQIFLILLWVDLWMSVFYIIVSIRDEKLLPFSHMGALVLETVIEILINAFVLGWFIYTDYRLFHSKDHLHRNVKSYIILGVIISIMDVVNIFTEFLIYFDEDLVYHETSLYVVLDIIRLGYCVASLVLLERHKRHEKRMKFFSVRSFFIPMTIYILLYYFTPFATVCLGIGIGLALIYVQMINEQCYQDMETGFYNRLYLSYLRSQIKQEKVEVSSAILFELSSDDIEKVSELIAAQLPQDCDTIRYGKKSIVTLAHVKDKSPLHMLAEDVKLSFEEAGEEIAVKYRLKKKKETGAEFLDRFLEKI